MRCGHRFTALVALALAGCYGNVSIGVGDDDEPPSVSLAVSPASAPAGAVVRLVAAASDDFGIDRVEFFRVDGALSTRLAIDGSAPYQLDTTLPGGAVSTVQYFARAVDDVGQSRDSDLVTVSIAP